LFVLVSGYVCSGYVAT